MKAFIFAAGLGTRLRPLTLTTPKPLIKLFDKPVIEYAIKSLELLGVTEFGINTFYLKEQFDYLPEKFPNIKLYPQEALYQQGGDLASAEDFVKNIIDNFIAINADTIFFIDPKEFEEIISNVNEQNPMLVIGFQSNSNPLEIQENKIIGARGVRFIETSSSTFRGDNSGIQFFDPSIKKYLDKPKNEFGFYDEKGLVKKIIDDGKNVLYFEPKSMIRFELSTLEDYENYRSSRELNFIIKSLQ